MVATTREIVNAVPCPQDQTDSPFAHQNHEFHGPCEDTISIPDATACEP